MSIHNIQHKLENALWQSPVTIKPVTDSDIFQFGDATTGFDVQFAGTALTDMIWDASAGALNLADNVLIHFGTGDDVTVEWDGTNLEWLPATDDTGAFHIGNGTKDMDVKIFLGASTDYVEFNVGTGQVNIESAELHLGDNDRLEFGDATAGDFALAWDGSWLSAELTAHTIWNGAPSPADPSVITHELFDDFISLHADWTVTEDSAGATQAVGDRNFGSVLLTNAATSDDDACQIQHAQETFQLINGKEIWFETRIKCAAGDATNLDFFVGLAEAEDLTGVADNMPANGLGFHKDDGDTNIDLSTSDGGTDVQQATVHTLVDATWVRLGFHFDGGATGSGTITPYIDGVAGTAITTAAYATMAELSPVFMIRNGDATTTQTLEVDYVKVIQER